jgi:hypothetical protein
MEYLDHSYFENNKFPCPKDDLFFYDNSSDVQETFRDPYFRRLAWLWEIVQIKHDLFLSRARVEIYRNKEFGVVNNAFSRWVQAGGKVTKDKRYKQAHEDLYPYFHIPHGAGGQERFRWRVFVPIVICVIVWILWLSTGRGSVLDPNSKYNKMPSVQATLSVSGFRLSTLPSQPTKLP